MKLQPCVPSLLEAGHIVPYRDDEDLRVDPHNGLCLAQTHHAAFDQGLFTFDEDLRLVLSKSLKDYLPNHQLSKDFVAFEGQPLQLPERFAPKKKYFEHHRNEIYVS